MEEVNSQAGRDGLESSEYGVNPSVLLLGEADQAERWSSAAHLAGCRVVDVLPLGGAMEAIERRIGFDAVVIDSRDEVELVSLSAGVGEQAANGRFGAVVATPFHLIDRIAGLDCWHHIEHVSEPTADERTTAIRRAAERRVPRLSDVNKAQATVRLQQLSEEVGRIANVLAALSEDEVAAAAVASVSRGEAEGEPLDAAFVRSIWKARRLRDQFFDPELFADPAWDMLLDLMVARLAKQRVAVSSLCIAAAVPSTTALRWIKTMCDRGHFVRVADPEDGRRVFIELSDHAAAALEGCLKSAQRISSLIV
jgi:hypothetical protein